MDTAMMRWRWRLFVNWCWCSRIGLAVSALCGWPIVSRVTVRGGVTAGRHARITQTSVDLSGERELSTVKSLLAATQERLAQIERDEDHRKTLAR